MNLEEKLKFFKDKGYKYNPETGEVTSHKGKIINGKTSQGYICLGIKINNRTETILAHQFAWYMYYDEVSNTIDHIEIGFDGRSNNKISNLRNVTHQQNCFNTNAKGYTMDKYGKYISIIKINNIRIYLGYYNTTEEAHQAYLDAKLIYHKI